MMKCLAILTFAFAVISMTECRYAKADNEAEEAIVKEAILKELLAESTDPDDEDEVAEIFEEDMDRKPALNDPRPWRFRFRGRRLVNAVKTGVNVWKAWQGDATALD